MKQGKLFELLINSLPYPDQMKKIQTKKDGSVRFSWRQNQYRISKTGEVTECGEGVTIYSTKALLIETLIKKTQIIRQFNNPKEK
jgi:hypothetical protein